MRVGSLDNVATEHVNSPNDAGAGGITLAEARALTPPPKAIPKPSKAIGLSPKGSSWDAISAIPTVVVMTLPHGNLLPEDDLAAVG